MDSVVATFEAIRDGDLRLCPANGVAYQADMLADRVRYDVAYLEKFTRYDAAIARAVNVGRCDMLARHLQPGDSVLDIGAGDGAFVRAALEAGFNAKGYEVIPSTAHALRLAELYDDQTAAYDAVTLWDVIEHMEDPWECLHAVRTGAVVFVSLPVFRDLRRVRDSKHYRPGEHLYYWTDRGFIAWMASCGFFFIERSSHEIEAGRDSIGAFAFRRDFHR